MKVIAVTLLVVGTFIGAGFASGREIVTFFGETPPFAVAAICAAIVFAACLILLLAARVAKPDNVSDFNAEIAGKAEPLLNLILLFNSLVSFAAMLAGMNSLLGGGNFGVVSVGFAVLSTFIVMRGMNGLYSVNNLLVPVLLGVIISVCLTVSSPVYPHFTLASTGQSVLYVGMNSLLAAGVLVKVNDLSVRQSVAVAALTALIVGAAMAFIIRALNASTIGGSDMPLVTLSSALSLPVRVLTIFSVAAGIFTTMLSAHLALADWTATLVKSKLFSAMLPAVAALAVSVMGFRTVVDALYPVLGVLGAGYLILCASYLIRSAVSLKQLGKHTHAEVHCRRKHTQHHG